MNKPGNTNGLDNTARHGKHDLTLKRRRHTRILFTKRAAQPLIPFRAYTSKRVTNERQHWIIHCAYVSSFIRKVRVLIGFCIFTLYNLSNIKLFDHVHTQSNFPFDERMKQRHIDGNARVGMKILNENIRLLGLVRNDRFTKDRRII